MSAHASRTDFAFWRKNPVECTSASTSSCGARASAEASGYFANSAGVVTCFSGSMPFSRRSVTASSLKA